MVPPASGAAVPCFFIRQRPTINKMKYLVTYGWFACIGVLAWMLQACQAIYEDLDYCPQGLVIGMDAQADDICSSVEGDTYQYLLSGKHQLAVGIYQANTTQPAKFEYLTTQQVRDAKVRFEGLAPGEYIVTVWTTPETDFNPYNTDHGVSFPWHTDTTAVGNGDRDLPMLYYGKAKLAFTRKPGVGSVDDSLTVNLKPYVQVFNFSFDGLEVGKTYRLTWQYQPLVADFTNGLINRPTTYTRSFVAKQMREQVNLTVMKPHFSVENTVLTFAMEGRKEPLLRKNFADIVADMEAGSDEKMHLECLERIPISFDFSTYARIHVRIFQWWVNYREINLGTND